MHNLSCENGGGVGVGEANKKGLKRVFQNKLLISVDQNTLLTFLNFKANSFYYQLERGLYWGWGEGF